MKGVKFVLDGAIVCEFLRNKDNLHSGWLTTADGGDVVVGDVSGYPSLPAPTTQLYLQEL